MSQQPNYTPPSQLHRKLSMLIVENDDYKRHVKLALGELHSAKDRIKFTSANFASLQGILNNVEKAIGFLEREKGDDYGSARQVAALAPKEGLTLPAPKGVTGGSD